MILACYKMNSAKWKNPRLTKTTLWLWISGNIYFPFQNWFMQHIENSLLNYFWEKQREGRAEEREKAANRDSCASRHWCFYQISTHSWLFIFSSMYSTPTPLECESLVKCVRGSEMCDSLRKWSTCAGWFAVYKIVWVRLRAFFLMLRWALCQMKTSLVKWGQRNYTTTNHDPNPSQNIFCLLLFLPPPKVFPKTPPSLL